MPRYKVNEKTYNLPEDKVEGFLQQFPDAIAIEDEAQDFPTSTVEDADAVQQPMTASQAGYVEPKDTELAPVDTSLDSPDPANEDFTLEQFKLMTPKEKNALSYSEKQRLSREKNNENNINIIDFSSDNFEKLEDKEKIRLQELAGKQITEQYSSEGIVDFEISENQIKEKAKELLKENKNPSLITSYGAQIARGFNSFAKGTVDFLDMTKFSLMEAGLEVFDDEYKSTPENKQAIMRAVKANIGSPIITPSSLNFDTFSEKLDPYIRQYENESIVDDIADGNYILAGQRAVGASLESLPSVVAAGLGLGGFIVLGASSAGGKFDEEFEKDPSINTGILVANAISSGVIEAGFEVATRGILKRAGILSNSGNKKAALDLIRGGSEGLIKNLGINTISEAGSEAATKTTSLLLDAVTLPGRTFDLGRDWKLIAEDALVGSVFGISATGGGAVKNRNINAVQAAEYILMPDQVKKVIEESGNTISKLYKNKANAEPEGINLINEAIELETAKILNIKKQNGRALNDMTPSEVKAYANNKSKINELKSIINKSGQKDIVKELAEDKLKTLQEVNKTLFKESSNRRVERNIQSVESLVKDVKGLTIESLDNAEAIDNFIKENNLDIDSKKASNQQGFIYQNPKTGNQTIIINKEISTKEQAVNVAAHEFLHGLIFQTVKNSPETQLALGKSLNEYINKIDATQVEDSNFAKRLESYKDMDEATQSEEVLTLFSDAIATGDIQFNESVFTKIGDVIRRTLQNLGVKVKFNNGKDVYNFVKDYNKSIEKGKLTKAQKAITEKQAKGKLVKEKIDSEIKTDIKLSKSLELQEQLDNLDESDYDFDLDRFEDAKNNLKFKINAAKKKEAKEFEEAKKPKNKNKSEVVKTINDFVPSSITSRDEFLENSPSNQKMLARINKAMEPNGIISNYIRGRASTPEMFDKVIASVRSRIPQYNPGAKRKSDSDAPITFAEFIFSNVNFGERDAKKALFKESEKSLSETSVESNEVQGKFADDSSESSTQGPVRKKYTPLTKSNIVPSFTTTAITDKLTGIVGKLKSKLTDASGVNSATTPLIREIKNNIGKVVGDAGAIPKLIIARLGNLKDGSYEKNLIKNKKAIIENMTTTFLMGKDNGKTVSGGIPQAIEKSVGGKYSDKFKTINIGGKESKFKVFEPNFVPYPEWVGQKIDREKSEQRGATAGNEIVKRVSADKVSDADFAGLFIDEKGKLIRGKREALGKALGEEIAFEIFTKEIQNENSAISKAFESNQEALGEVLKDNFVAVLEKDLDRGTVKFSMSLKERKNLINVAISEGINSQKIKDIAIKNGIPEKEFSAVLENIIHEGILQKMQDAEASNQGLKYEEALEVVLNTFTSSDIKVEKIKRRKGDISIKGGGKTYKVEVKLNDKAQIGSISTGLFTIKDSVVSLKDSNNLKINSKLSEENKKVFVDFLNNNKKYLNNLVKAINEANAESSEKAIINKNGHLKLPYSEFWENIKDKMPNNQAGYISYEGNQSIIEDFYKSIDLMQIGDYGAYAIGNQSNLAGFYQKLEATTTNVLRPVRSGTTVYIRLFPNFKEIKNERKDSLSTAKGISTLAKTIRAAVELDYIETGQKAINNANSNTYFKLSKRLDVKAEDISELTTNKAKADWLINKIAEGYNDFYFIDNKMNKVKAVKDVLNTFDVKGKVQQAKVKFSKSMNTTFNEMLQRSTGIEAGETIERSIARRRGATKGKFKVWMPSSLDDFKGLTSYTFAGKGKQGEADQKFFQDALITPYFRGIRAIEQSRQAFKDDFKALNKQMRPVLKKLGKIIPGTEFTHDQAIRVALWTASGYNIPGISESDIKTLVDFVNDNADLSEYTRKLQLISKRKEWSKPGDFWDAETILSDLNNLTEKVGRKEYLTEFIENVDIIFSEDNLNKVEAGYGEAQKEALKDIIYRMKNGTNRPSGANKNENRFNNWVNNSIGAIMFFNRRSALLQTLSIANFINWGDNNVLKAGAAFANQPQYWKDFATLFNSSKLKQRRSGLKSDVNEAEIANAVKGSRNKAVSALSYLLKIGFTPTQLADSFAIASGGATFYRNRANSYLKEVNAEGEKVYTQKQAEEKAFEDFSQISEETQQSGDPALISSDQASTLGRMILAFQNTPIQLNRSIKKAALDIKNRRRTPGQTMLQSDFSNISKIIYYGTVQNIIFSALQNALFALIPGFEDEDDELTEEEQLEKYGKIYSTKQSRIVNGMVDTTLKGGFGVPGAFISTIKNAYLEYAKQREKGFIGDQGYTILAAANLSPPVGSKLRKIYSAIKTEEFDKDIIAKRGWDITIDGKFNLSPNYKVFGSVTEGLTNLPLDRMVAEVSSITEALDARNSKWQRIALALGWKTWDVGAENEEHELIKTEAKAKRKEEGKIKAKETRAKNKKEKEIKARLEERRRINRMNR